MAKISYLPSIDSTEPRPLSFTKYLQGIKTGVWREQVEAVRTAKKKGKKAYDKAKKSLPAVTVSGVFEGGHSKGQLFKRSGILAIDIDAKDNPDGINYSELLEDESFYALHKSAGGKGVVVYALYEGSHRGTFEAVKDHLLTAYGLTVDESCKNINRLRFVSYDSDMVAPNEEAILWVGGEEPEAIERPEEVEYLEPTEQDLADVEELVYWALEHNEVVFEDNESYWNSLMVALAQYGDTFKGHAKKMVRLWDRMNPHNPNKSFAAEWDRAKGYGAVEGGIGLGSFINAFKEAGYRPPRKKVTLSGKGKKGRPKGSKNKKKEPGSFRKLYRVGTEITKKVEEAVAGEPLIPNLILAGELTLFAGPNNVGKSIQAIQWGVQVARRHKRVLYVDWELSYVQYKGRYGGYEWSKYFARSGREEFWEQDMGTDDLIEVLDQMVAEFSPDLLIIDNITAIEGGGDTSQALDAKVVMEWLTGFKRIKPGMGILVLMHTIKINKYRAISLKEVRGSGVYTDLSDAVILMNRVKPEDEEDAEDPKVYMKQEKFRSGRVTYGEYNCIVKRYSNNEAGNFLHLSTVGDGFKELDLVPEDGGESPKQIEARLIKKYCLRLLAQGFKNKDVAEMLGITTVKVSRIKKEAGPQTSIDTQ